MQGQKSVAQMHSAENMYLVDTKKFNFKFFLEQYIIGYILKIEKLN